MKRFLLYVSAFLSFLFVLFALLLCFRSESVPDGGHSDDYYHGYREGYSNGRNDTLDDFRESYFIIDPYDLHDSVQALVNSNDITQEQADLLFHSIDENTISYFSLLDLEDFYSPTPSPTPTFTPTPTPSPPPSPAPTFTPTPIPTPSFTPTPTPTPQPAPAQTQSRTVYITASGEKYHRQGCQYLRQSCYSISLDDAIAQGYTPCKKCKP